MNIQELKKLAHKKGVNPDDWDIVNPNLRILAYETIEYCESRKLPILITSIIREKIPGISKSDTHREGRAYDLSVHGWSEKDCLDFEKYLNENYANLGAISAKDGVARACVYHMGTAMHHHIQCRR